MVDITLTALEGRHLKAWVLVDPQLTNDGSDDRADTRHGTLPPPTAAPPARSPARRPSPRRSSGYLGTSDGWADLRSDVALDRHYGSAPERATSCRPGGPKARPAVGQQHADAGAGLREHRRGAPPPLPRARCSAGFPAVAAVRTPPAGTPTWTRSSRAPAVGRRPAADVRRLADGARRLRGQGQPRRVRRLADDALGLGHRVARTRPAPTTWSGRATSTRSPRRCSRPATAGRAAARCTSCSTASRSPTARSRRTRPSTARRHWTNAPARRGRRPDHPGLAARPARRHHVPGRTSAGRRLRRSPTGPGPRRSGGRTRPATRRRRSPPRSPAWSAPPTSPARTATARPRRAT